MLNASTVDIPTAIMQQKMCIQLQTNIAYAAKALTVISTRLIQRDGDVQVLSMTEFTLSMCVLMCILDAEAWTISTSIK